MPEVMAFGVCLALVMTLCSRRFNTPMPVRSYTTSARYYSGVALYALAGALVYVTVFQLVATPRTNVHSAFLITLVLSLILPWVPGGSHLDAWLRHSLRRMIGFPSEARRLAAAISATRMERVLPVDLRELC